MHLPPREHNRCAMITAKKPLSTRKCTLLAGIQNINKNFDHKSTYRVRFVFNLEKIEKSLNIGSDLHMDMHKSSSLEWGAKWLVGMCKWEEFNRSASQSNGFLPKRQSIFHFCANIYHEWNDTAKLAWIKCTGETHLNILTHPYGIIFHAMLANVILSTLCANVNCNSDLVRNHFEPNHFSAMLNWDEWEKVMRNGKTAFGRSMHSYTAVTERWDCEGKYSLCIWNLYSLLKVRVIMRCVCVWICFQWDFFSCIE